MASSNDASNGARVPCNRAESNELLELGDDLNDTFDRLRETEVALRLAIGQDCRRPEFTDWLSGADQVKVLWGILRGVEQTQVALREQMQKLDQIRNRITATQPGVRNG